MPLLQQLHVMCTPLLLLSALPCHQYRCKLQPNFTGVDLRDLPVGVTGEDGYEIVQAGKKADKVAASKRKRAKCAAPASERLWEAVACGSHVISLRSHDEHLEALTVHEMVDVLACRACRALNGTL